MERIIRNILNYDVYHSTEAQRDELAANITALSLFLLEKTDYFNVPNNIRVENEQMYGASYGDGLIKLSNYAFLDTVEHAFANDITVLAHEACHYAQEYSKNDQDNVISGRDFNYVPDRFEPMFFFLVQFFYPDYFKALQTLGPKFVADMNDELSMFYDYFYSFYELQPYEIEANKFSIELFKYIIKIAEKLDLTEKEKRNLETLKKSLPLIDTYDFKIDHYKKLRQDPSTVRKVRTGAIRVVERLFQCTNFIEELYKEGVEIESESITRTVLDVVCQCLELNYDDDLAKIVMKMLLSAKPNDVRDRYLFQLAFWTPYQFSEVEEKQIKEILSKTNIDIKKLSYEELLKEKKKVVNEREDMMRRRNKPVREFKFE